MDMNECTTHVIVAMIEKGLPANVVPEQIKKVYEAFAKAGENL